MSGIEFNFQEMPMGGSALDLVGVPLPDETLLAAKKSDAVLLGAIGGCLSLFKLSLFTFIALIVVKLLLCFVMCWLEGTNGIKMKNI